MIHYGQPNYNPYEGLFSVLGTALGQNYAQRGEDKREKAILDTKTDVNNMQFYDPNPTIGTNYDTIQQLTNNPLPQANQFVNGNIPTDQNFLK